MRKNAAIDEELTELGARLQTLQRNIAAKRLARGSIKSAEQHRRRPDNLRYSDMLDLRQSGELEADASGACAHYHMTSRANALRQRICDQFIRGVVNGARTRLIAWEVRTYVGEDPKGSARKRTDRLSYCQYGVNTPSDVFPKVAALFSGDCRCCR